MTIDHALREMLRDLLHDEVRAALRELETQRSTAPVHSPGDRYLTAEQAAELVSVRPATVRSWAARGELLACYAGRKLRIKSSDLQAFMERPRKGSTERSEHEDAAFVDAIFREDALRCAGCGHLQKLHQGVKCSARKCDCTKYVSPP